MNQQNNFANHKPTIVLYAPDGMEPQALIGHDGKPHVFPNFAKASKHVSRFIDPKMHPDIQYVNEVPVIGAGDREATSNKRCLKCNSFLRPSNQVARERVHGKSIEIEAFVCPQCDLGE